MAAGEEEEVGLGSDKRERALLFAVITIHTLQKETTKKAPPFLLLLHNHPLSLQDIDIYLSIYLSGYRLQLASASATRSEAATGGT